MKEVSGPVIAIALILASVFVPVASWRHPGAIEQAVRRDDCDLRLISAFNALTLSPALSALLPRPRKNPKAFSPDFSMASTDCSRRRRAATSTGATPRSARRR